MRRWIEYAFFRSLICAVQILSLRQCAAFGELLAGLMIHPRLRRWTRYELACRQIRESLGPDLSDAEVEQTLHRMWLHLFRMVAEMVHLPRKLRLENVFDWISFHQRNLSVSALCSGRPVILVSGHFGNWELAMTIFGHFGFPIGFVARPLDNPYLHAWFLRSRGQTGAVAIPKKGGSDQVVAFLERRGIVALLADQDAGKRGLFVDFFGRPASTFKSIALLALQYRALICVGYARRLPDEPHQSHPRFELGCEELVDPDDFSGADAIEQITARYTQALEKAIRKSPEQYFWVHRRWKSQPRQRRRKAA